MVLMFHICALDVVRIQSNIIIYRKNLDFYLLFPMVGNGSLLDKLFLQVSSYTIRELDRTYHASYHNHMYYFPYFFFTLIPYIIFFGALLNYHNSSI